MEKLKLFRIYDIVCEDGCVVSAEKELIVDLENEDDALKYPKELEELYLIKFDENDNPISIHGMVFGECENWFDESLNILDKPRGVLPPYLDSAEYDYRVIASVAFKKDWV